MFSCRSRWFGEQLTKVQPFGVEDMWERGLGDKGDIRDRKGGCSVSTR